MSLAGEEDGVAAKSGLEMDQLPTDPEQVGLFVCETGVHADILVGTSHGAYKILRPPSVGSLG